MASATSPVLVRPRRSLMRTAFISVVLGMLPIFAVLYWFGSRNGSWPIVLCVHSALVVASLLTLVRQLRVFSAVSATELSGNGIFSPVERIPLGAIASVTLVPTYVGQVPEPVQQLLALDARGHTLFRMRGNFWHPGDLTAIATAIPVPSTVVKEPIGIQEFFDTYPGSAYWFENNPALRVGIVIGAIAIVLGVLLFSVLR